MYQTHERHDNPSGHYGHEKRQETQHNNRQFSAQQYSDSVDGRLQTGPQHYDRPAPGQDRYHQQQQYSRYNPGRHDVPYDDGAIVRETVVRSTDFSQEVPRTYQQRIIQRPRPEYRDSTEPGKLQYANEPRAQLAYEVGYVSANPMEDIRKSYGKERTQGYPSSNDTRKTKTAAQKSNNHGEATGSLHGYRREYIPQLEPPRKPSRSYKTLHSNAQPKNEVPQSTYMPEETQLQKQMDIDRMFMRRFKWSTDQDELDNKLSYDGQHEIRTSSEQLLRDLPMESDVFIAEHSPKSAHVVDAQFSQKDQWSPSRYQTHHVSVEPPKEDIPYHRYQTSSPQKDASPSYQTHHITVEPPKEEKKYYERYQTSPEQRDISPNYQKQEPPKEEGQLYQPPQTPYEPQKDTLNPFSDSYNAKIQQRSSSASSGSFSSWTKSHGEFTKEPEVQVSKQHEELTDPYQRQQVDNRSGMSQLVHSMDTQVETSAQENSWQASRVSPNQDNHPMVKEDLHTSRDHYYQPRHGGKHQETMINEREQQIRSRDQRQQNRYEDVHEKTTQPRFVQSPSVQDNTSGSVLNEQTRIHFNKESQPTAGDRPEHSPNYDYPQRYVQSHSDHTEKIGNFDPVSNMDPWNTQRTSQLDSSHHSDMYNYEEKDYENKPSGSVVYNVDDRVPNTGAHGVNLHSQRTYLTDDGDFNSYKLSLQQYSPSGQDSVKDDDDAESPPEQEHRVHSISPNLYVTDKLGQMVVSEPVDQHEPDVFPHQQYTYYTEEKENTELQHSKYERTPAEMKQTEPIAHYQNKIYDEENENNRDTEYQMKELDNARFIPEQAPEYGLGQQQNWGSPIDDTPTEMNRNKSQEQASPQSKVSYLPTKHTAATVSEHYSPQHQPYDKVRRDMNTLTLIRDLEKNPEESLNDLVLQSTTQEAAFEVWDEGFESIVKFIMPSEGFLNQLLLQSGNTELRDYYAGLESNANLINAVGILRNVTIDNPFTRLETRRYPFLVQVLVVLMDFAINVDVDCHLLRNLTGLLKNLSYGLQEVVDPEFMHKWRTETHKPVTQKEEAASSGWFGAKKKKKTKKTTYSVQTAVSSGTELSGCEGLIVSATIGIYITILLDSKVVDTLANVLGIIQNMTACDWGVSTEFMDDFRKAKGLPSLVELLLPISELLGDTSPITRAVVGAIWNLTNENRNLELIAKYAIRNVVKALGPPAEKVASSDERLDNYTLSAILVLLLKMVSFEHTFLRACVNAQAVPKLISFTKDAAYTNNVQTYASMLLNKMWAAKDLHSELKSTGWKKEDFLFKPRGELYQREYIPEEEQMVKTPFMDFSKEATPFDREESTKAMPSAPEVSQENLPSEKPDNNLPAPEVVGGSAMNDYYDQTAPPYPSDLGSPTYTEPPPSYDSIDRYT